jgi:exodeoxyribonuclease X
MIHVIDTETTGMDPATAEVVELACVDLERGDAWSALIKPAGPIPPQASAVHHLTADDFGVAYSDLPEAWRAMVTSMGTAHVYAAHNAEFDSGFLKTFTGQEVEHEVGRVQTRGNWLCTWRCALHLFPDAPGYSNQVLRYHLGLKPFMPEGLAPHRALYDTLVTAELLRVMLTMRPVDDLLMLQHQPVVLKTCGFGKHRGTPWSEVPRDYLQWIVRNGEFDRDTLHTAKFWIAGGR